MNNIYKNKIKSVLALKGHTIRSFCEMTGRNYQNFLRFVNLGKLNIREVEDIAITLNLNEREVIQFFLPMLFENLKQSEQAV